MWEGPGLGKPGAAKVLVWLGWEYSRQGKGGARVGTEFRSQEMRVSAAEPGTSVITLPPLPLVAATAEGP